LALYLATYVFEYCGASWLAPRPREIVGNDLDGQPMKLSNFRGKVVLLAFWKDGEEDSESLQAYMRKFLHKHQVEPYTIAGVSTNRSLETAKAVAHKHG